jgi:hypothetical protein
MTPDLRIATRDSLREPSRAVPAAPALVTG